MTMPRTGELVPEPIQKASSIHELREQIRKLSAQQAKTLGDAVYVGMTAELARECDERRRKIHDLVELLTRHYDETFQVREVAQVGVLCYLNQKVQSAYRTPNAARAHTFRDDRSHPSRQRRDR